MSYQHHVLHAVRGRLWKDAAEAAALWRALAAAFPDAPSICLMPTHAHLVLPDGDHARELSRAISGYARFRNHRHGDSGPVFAPTSEPSNVSDDRHLRRTVRYLALNPVRDGLVTCPLGWTWSTHRDRCGLSWPRVGKAHARPGEWHAYVATDHETAPHGTPFPARAERFVEWEELEAAVASVLRDPAADVTRRGPARDAFIGASLTVGRDPAEVAGRAKVTLRRVQQLAAADPDPIAAICVRVAGDPRFS